MKLNITEYKDSAEVTIKDGCQIIHSFTFGDYKQAKAFCQGFNCAKTVANSLIQSMPMTYERITDRTAALDVITVTTTGI